FNSDVDSIAFGVPGTKLANLFFVSHTDEASPGTGSELTMIDVATLQRVAIATGGTRGDELKASADGRLFISQSHQVDVLNPIQPPHVSSTNPPPQGIVSLPLGTMTVTFDQDMLADDASDPHSILNPANYHLTGDASGPVAINSVVYDAASRTATLSFDNLN